MKHQENSQNPSPSKEMERENSDLKDRSPSDDMQPQQKDLDDQEDDQFYDCAEDEKDLKRIDQDHKLKHIVSNRDKSGGFSGTKRRNSYTYIPEEPKEAEEEDELEEQKSSHKVSDRQKQL